MKFHRTQALRYQQGLTLIEMLVGVALAAILLALITPSALQMITGGHRAKCASNLRQIGGASSQFASEHRGALPNFYWSATPDESPQAPAAAVGQWFWHLAPYLGVPRRENAGMNLGTPNAGLPGPVVFTCPANTREEDNGSFLTYPSFRPVSYAPSTQARGDTPMNLAGIMPTEAANAYLVYPVLTQRVVSPSKKIWISDSPTAGVLNVSASRWSEAYSPASGAWPRVAFTRHRGGGNALFYDGHVEWLPVETFTRPPDGVNMAVQLRRYFDPYYEN